MPCIRVSHVTGTLPKKTLLGCRLLPCTTSDRVETAARRPRAGLGGARRADAQGVAGQAPTVLAWLSDQGPRRAIMYPRRASLKVRRSTWAAPWPGQALVVLDPHRMLITDVCLSEDGHASERRLSAQVLQHVREGDPLDGRSSLCPRALMFGMARRGAVRRPSAPPGAGRAPRPPRTPGPHPQGLALYEQPMPVHAPDRGEPLRVRRITLTLQQPTRDGAPELHILSNVPIHRASAAPLARLSRKRWSIETACFEITTTLSCEIKTLGSPKAALFPCCLALLAYNAVSLINAALRRAHGRKKGPDEVSGHDLSWAIGRTYDGMMSAMPALHWALFRDLSDKAFVNVWRELASSVTLSKYQKQPRGPKKAPPERTAYQNGKHVSTAKLIAQRRSC